MLLRSNKFFAECVSYPKGFLELTFENCNKRIRIFKSTGTDTRTLIIRTERANIVAAG